MATTPNPATWRRMHQTHGPAVDPTARRSCNHRPQRVSSGIRLFRNSAFLMGATLEACALDLGFWDTAPSRDAQLSAYMCLSRVKRCEDVCVTQAFSPNLFQNGELIGPHTYLEFHRKKLSVAQAKARFEKDALPDRLLPLRDFVTVWDREAWYKILAEGKDRLCTQCRSPESGKQLPTPTDEPDACPYCQGEHGPATSVGFCRRCVATVRLSCARCDKGKKFPLKPYTSLARQKFVVKKQPMMCGVPAARPVSRRLLPPLPSKASASSATKP